MVQLHKTYGSNGLQILAFPCSGSQEYKDASKINEFSKKFGVEFPIMEITQCRGTNCHPIFQFLKSNTIM